MFLYAFRQLTIPKGHKQNLRHVLINTFFFINGKKTWIISLNIPKVSVGQRSMLKDQIFLICRQVGEPNKSLSTLSLCTKTSYYLRYPLWRDKAGGLDHRQACSWEHVYQLDFHPCRNNFLGSNETEAALSGFDSIQDERYNKQIPGILFLLCCLPMKNLAFD